MSLLQAAKPTTRMQGTVAKAYRLVKKQSGELVLQGAFEFWEENCGGFEWKDIPTVEEEA